MNPTEEFKVRGTAPSPSFSKNDFLRLEKMLTEGSEIQTQRLQVHQIKLNYPLSSLEINSFANFFDEGGAEARGNPSSVEVNALARDSDDERRINQPWIKWISVSISASEASCYITGTSQPWVLGKREELTKFFESKRVKVYTVPPIIVSLVRFIATITAYLGINGLLQQRYLTGAIVVIVSALSYLSVDFALRKLNSSIPSGIFFLERPIRRANYPLLQLCASLLAISVTLIIGILNLSKTTP